MSGILQSPVKQKHLVKALKQHKGKVPKLTGFQKNALVAFNVLRASEKTRLSDYKSWIQEGLIEQNDALMPAPENQAPEALDMLFEENILYCPLPGFEESSTLKKMASENTKPIKNLEDKRPTMEALKTKLAEQNQEIRHLKQQLTRLRSSLGFNASIDPKIKKKLITYFKKQNNKFVSGI